MGAMQRKIRKTLLAVLVAACAAGSSGCGFFIYSHRILKTNKAIAQAKVNNAEEYAPYEWTYAVEHAKKAKEEVAHSDYQAAIILAKDAEAKAIKAKEIARKLKMEAGRETDE